MAAGKKGKTLLYTCTIVSSVAILLIILDIFGLIRIPNGEPKSPLGSGRKFDLTFFLSFNVFPVLILFNLVFWTFTAVSGRVINSKPYLRQMLVMLYMFVTLGLLGILTYRFLYA